MKKIFTNILGLSILLFSIVTAHVSFPQLTWAQDSTESKESITLSPARATPKVNAGTTLRGNLAVINDGESEYEFLVYARPYSVTSENYDPSYTEVNERTIAYQWVQFEKTKMKLGPGERVEVPYTITVPSKATAGGHYAVLFAETQPKKATGTQVARKKRVGSLLYITVDGKLINSGSLVGWDAQFWQKSKPLTSSIRIKNDGNVHFQTNSQVTFSNIFNKPRLQLKQEQFVLPGTTRKIAANMEKAPLVGIYRVSGSVSFLDKNEILGSKWIILVPPQAIFVALVFLTVLIAWIVIKKRTKLHKDKNDTAIQSDKK